MLSGSCSSLAYCFTGQFRLRFRRRTTNLYKDVPVAIIVEGIAIENLELFYFSRPLLVLCHELLIREPPLGVFVEELHIRVGRCRIQVIIQFFHIFAMITLVARHAEKAFFENWVLAVPE